MRAGNRKQAIVPRGATILEPVGTAPGLVVPPLDGDSAAPTVLVLPGPPSELRPMWETALDDRRAARRAGRGGPARAADPAALRDPRVRDRRDAAGDRGRRRPARAPGDHHLPAAGRDRDRDGVRARGGSPCTPTSRPACVPGTPTRSSPRTARPSTSRSRALLARAGLDRRRGRVLHRRADGRAADRPPRLLGVRARAGWWCTPTTLKTGLVGVPAELIERVGAVSAEVAAALADGAATRSAPTWGSGSPGVAGPDGGSEAKPVGTVH